MSGGSYNYLCYKDADDVLQARGDLYSMANRLDALCPEAAAETRALFDGPKSLCAELEGRLARLSDLWHAVEWRDSNDWGDDQVREAVDAFRAQGSLSGALPGEVSRMGEIQRLVDEAGKLLAEAQKIASRPWLAAEGKERSDP